MTRTRKLLSCALAALLLLTMFPAAVTATETGDASATDAENEAATTAEAEGGATSDASSASDSESTDSADAGADANDEQATSQTQTLTPAAGSTDPVAPLAEETAKPQVVSISLGDGELNALGDWSENGDLYELSSDKSFLAAKVNAQQGDSYHYEIALLAQYPVTSNKLEIVFNADVASGNGYTVASDKKTVTLSELTQNTTVTIDGIKWIIYQTTRMEWKITGLDSAAGDKVERIWHDKSFFYYREHLKDYSSAALADANTSYKQTLLATAGVGRKVEVTYTMGGEEKTVSNIESQTVEKVYRNGTLVDGSKTLNGPTVAMKAGENWEITVAFSDIASDVVEDTVGGILETSVNSVSAAAKVITDGNLGAADVLKVMESDPAVAQKIEALEDASTYLPKYEVTDALKDVVGTKNDISAVGLVFNATAESDSVTLTIDEASGISDEAVTDAYANIVRLDISLDSNARDVLIVPVRITMPIPKGNGLKNDSTLRILHYTSANDYEVITPTRDGSRVTFTVTKFSVFAFANVKSTGGSGGSSSGSSGSNGSWPSAYPTESLTPITPAVPPVVPNTPSAANPFSYRVLARSLNVRSGPGTSFAKVGTLRANDVVSVIGYSADGLWAQTQAGSWVSMAFVSQVVSVDVGDYIVTVKSGSLNVRSGPGTSSAKIGSLANNALVMVTSVTNGWAQIEYNGGVGYVSVLYLR